MPAPLIAAAAKYAAAKVASKLSKKVKISFGKKKKKKVKVSGIKQPVSSDPTFLTSLHKAYSRGTTALRTPKVINKRIGARRVAKMSAVAALDVVSSQNPTIGAARMLGTAVGTGYRGAKMAGFSFGGGGRRRRRRKSGLQGREIGQLVLMKSLLGSRHPATLIYAIRAVQGGM